MPSIEDIQERKFNLCDAKLKLVDVVLCNLLYLFNTWFHWPQAPKTTWNNNNKFFVGWDKLTGGLTNILLCLWCSDVNKKFRSAGIKRLQLQQSYVTEIAIYSSYKDKTSIHDFYIYDLCN